MTTNNRPPPPDVFVLGWAQGVGDAGVRLLAIAAAELGPDHPVVDRMITALGQLASDPRHARTEPRE